MGGRLVVVMLLNFLITAVEVVGGLYAGSLSLLSDALHNLSDGVAVVVSYVALRLSKKKSTELYTFGYKRAEILASLFNASVLLVIAVFLFKEAVYRLYYPVNVKGSLMIYVALVGLVANTLSVFLLHKGTKDSLNIRSVYLHLLTDALSSVAVVVGGVFIACYGVMWVDPVLTLGIGVYVLRESFGMVMESVGILMHRAPKDIDLSSVKMDIESINGVKNLHHVHLWQVSEDDIHFEGHIELTYDMRMSEVDKVRKEVENLLRERYSVNHPTLQFEHQSCDDNSMVRDD